MAGLAPAPAPTVLGVALAWPWVFAPAPRPGRTGLPPGVPSLQAAPGHFFPDPHRVVLLTGLLCPSLPLPLSLSDVSGSGSSALSILGDPRKGPPSAACAPPAAAEGTGVTPPPLRARAGPPPGQRVDWRREAAGPGAAHPRSPDALLGPSQSSSPGVCPSLSPWCRRRLRHGVCQRWRRQRGCQATARPPPSPGRSAAPGAAGVWVMGNVISSGCGFCCVWGQRGQGPSWSQSAARWGGTATSSQNQWDDDDLHVPHTQPERGQELCLPQS